MQAMINKLNQCKNHPQRVDEVFDRLPAETSNDLMSLAYHVSYPANVLLFSEMDTSQKVFVILDGAVKLSINTSDGKRLILRIARQGEMIGLSSALSGKPYEVTAETLHPTKVAQIGRPEFLGFLARHPEAYQLFGEELGRQFTQACNQLRTVGLSSSAPEKVARLLIDWSRNGQTSENGTRFHFSLTHQEIGEFIGSTRETVTRCLNEFKQRRLVSFHGSTLTIPSMVALEIYARC